jgi:mRNA interferase MazF
MLLTNPRHGLLLIAWQKAILCMMRGDIVSVVAPGDYGKPRPAVVIQCDLLTQAGLGSVVLCLVTSHQADAPTFRIPLKATEDTGLEHDSQIMTDKLLTVPLTRVGGKIGRLDDETMIRLNRTLAFVIGLA